MFYCDSCGKICGSRAGLTKHMFSSPACMPRAAASLRASTATPAMLELSFEDSSTPGAPHHGTSGDEVITGDINFYTNLGMMGFDSDGTSQPSTGVADAGQVNCDNRLPVWCCGSPQREQHQCLFLDCCQSKAL